eukprot:1107558-Alexandrium_andersonii.AAC.1
MPSRCDCRWTRAIKPVFLYTQLRMAFPVPQLRTQSTRRRSDRDPALLNKSRLFCKIGASNQLAGKWSHAQPCTNNPNNLRRPPTHRDNSIAGATLSLQQSRPWMPTRTRVHSA